MEAIALSRLDSAYREHRTKLWKFVRSKVADLETVEDIIQDVFAGASASAAEPIENLAAWLFQSASNRIVDWYRRRYRTEVTLEDESRSLEELLARSDIDLHNDLVRDTVIEELYSAIDELPDSQREVILRQAIGGETFREISEDTGIPLNTLLARKRYAVAALRKRLQDVKELIQDILS